MKGSEFVQLYANKGPVAWEAATLEIARRGELTPWPWIDLSLTDGTNTVVLKVQSDVVSVGPVEDHLRMPLTPGVAQSIANLSGALLPTPWIVYQIWRAAPNKVAPISAGNLGQQNLGPSLQQYAVHSLAIDRQLEGAADPRALTAGIKKHVVVSNLAKRDRVLIFGWYRPPPFPDVFDDGTPMANPQRQPVQPKSNLHGDGYVDYSHGIQLVGPIAMVNGQPMATEDVYRDPVLSALVSNEGPVKVIRYPAAVPPAPLAVVVPNRPAHVATYPAAVDVFTRDTPSPAEVAILDIQRQRR